MAIDHSFMTGYELVRRSSRCPEFTPRQVAEAIDAANSGLGCNLGRVAAAEYMLFTKALRDELKKSRGHAAHANDFPGSVDYLELSWEHLDGMVKEHLPEAHSEAGLDK